MTDEPGVVHGSRLLEAHDDITGQLTLQVAEVFAQIGRADVPNARRRATKEPLMGSLDSYLPIFLLLVLGFLFAALSIIASKLLAPKRPTTAKEAPYECGIVPTFELPHRFPVRFYLVAMIFVIFDIEVIFLFPWAVVYNGLGTFGLVEIIIFSAAVFISFLYLVANGALDWGPLQKIRPASEQIIRTTMSTVRRVSSRSDEAA